jgi:hypothetical protein
MELYAGLDLHSRNTYIGIVDKAFNRVFKKRGSSDFLMGIYCMLWFLPVWNMNHALLPLNTIG